MSAVRPSSDPQPEAARPIRVLYVDDEPALVGLAERKLRGMGFEVTGMTNSAEALNRFQDHPHDFDVVVSDIAMPEPSGDHLVRLIHRLRPDMPIVLISGNDPHLSGGAAQKLNIVAFLNKPFRMEDLAGRMRAMVRL